MHTVCKILRLLSKNLSLENFYTNIRYVAYYVLVSHCPIAPFCPKFHELFLGDLTFFLTSEKFSFLFVSKNFWSVSKICCSCCCKSGQVQTSENSPKTSNKTLRGRVMWHKTVLKQTFLNTYTQNVSTSVDFIWYLFSSPGRAHCTSALWPKHEATAQSCLELYLVTLGLPGLMR